MRIFKTLMYIAFIISIFELLNLSLCPIYSGIRRCVKMHKIIACLIRSLNMLLFKVAIFYQALITFLLRFFLDFCSFFSVLLPLSSLVDALVVLLETDFLLTGAAKSDSTV